MSNKTIKGRGFNIAAAAAAVLSAVLINGCATVYDKEPVAVIDGTYVITINDYLYRYERTRAVAGENSPQIDSYGDAEDFLDQLITGRILEIEAEKRGYGEDESLKRAVSAAADELLREELKKDIATTIRVTDADVGRYYDRLFEDRYVRVILSEERGAFDQVKLELLQGKTFDEVASVYNANPILRERGGLLDKPIRYDGSFLTELVYGLGEVGGISEVAYLPDNSAYVMVKLEKIELVEPSLIPGFDEIKDDIRASLTEVKTVEKINDIIDRRRETAEIEYDRDVYEAVFVLPQDELKRDFAKRGYIVCTADGEPVSFDGWFEGVNVQTGLNDATLDVFKAQDPQGYRRLMDDRLRAFINAALMLAEAKDRALDKREGYLTTVNNIRSLHLIERLDNEVFVPSIPLPTENEMIHYYEVSEKYGGKDLNDVPVGLSVFNELYNRKLNAPDTERRYQLWYTRLKSRHRIETSDENLRKAYNRIITPKILRLNRKGA